MYFLYNNNKASSIDFFLQRSVRNNGGVSIENLRFTLRCGACLLRYIFHYITHFSSSGSLNAKGTVYWIWKEEGTPRTKGCTVSLWDALDWKYCLWFGDSQLRVFSKFVSGDRCSRLCNAMDEAGLECGRTWALTLPVWRFCYSCDTSRCLVLFSRKRK